MKSLLISVLDIPIICLFLTKLFFCPFLFLNRRLFLFEGFLLIFLHVLMSMLLSSGQPLWIQSIHSLDVDLFFSFWSPFDIWERALLSILPISETKWKMNYDIYFLNQDHKTLIRKSCRVGYLVYLHIFQ